VLKQATNEYPFPTPCRQVITATLRRHIEAAPANARKLQPLIAPIMEAVAALIETGIPEALAPFSRHAGPVVDSEDLDRTLQAMYAECSAACRGAGTRRGAATAATGGSGVEEG
jgi:hypothetical protein